MYEVIYTGQFKKSLKLCALIDFMVIMKDVGNVILHQIGC